MLWYKLPCKFAREVEKMKRNVAIIVLLTAFLIFISGCGKKNEYILDEKTFFLVMTNMQYYPEQYEARK